MIFYGGEEDQLLVTLDGHEYIVPRAHLGLYLVLGQLREAKDVLGYLRANKLPTNVSGLEGLTVYRNLVRFNTPQVSFPFLRSAEEHQQEAWYYPNRWVVVWIHLVAATYHWTRDQILELDVSEFCAYVQEILVDKQFEREWVYQLSEIAYPYDEGAKAGVFKPLRRPGWMHKMPRGVKNLPEMFRPKGPVSINLPSSKPSKS